MRQGKSSEESQESVMNEEEEQGGGPDAVQLWTRGGYHLATLFENQERRLEPRQLGREGGCPGSRERRMKRVHWMIGVMKTVGMWILG